MGRTSSEDSKSEKSFHDTLQSEPLGDDIEAEMQAAGAPKMFQRDTVSHVASALGSRPMQMPMAMDTHTLTLRACPVSYTHLTLPTILRV